MMCPYCEIANYAGLCRCTAGDNEICMFMYRCTAERRWKPLEGMSGCTLRLDMAGQKKLQPNENKVRFESKGKLYVEYDNGVIKVDNPFDNVPYGVEIIMVEGKPYVKGYEPEIKAEYNPKANTNVERKSNSKRTKKKSK